MTFLSRILLICSGKLLVSGRVPVESSKKRPMSLSWNWGRKENQWNLVMFGYLLGASTKLVISTVITPICRGYNPSYPFTMPFIGAGPTHVTPFVTIGSGSTLGGDSCPIDAQGLITMVSFRALRIGLFHVPFHMTKFMVVFNTWGGLILTRSLRGPHRLTQLPGASEAP